jgi:outer membrane protein TolC
MLVLSVCLCRFAYPQEAGGEGGLTLSLDDAVRLGVENNLDLRSSRMSLSSAEFSANRLWAQVFPTISASVGTNYSGGPLFSDGSASPDFRSSASAGISLDLNAGLPFAMRNITLAYQTRLLNYEVAQKQLERDITRNFYSLIADGNRLNVLGETLNQVQQQYERDMVAFNNGRINELTLMDSSLAVESARLDRNSAQLAYSNSMNAFFVLIGMEDHDNVQLVGEIAVEKIELDAEQLIHEHLAGRPDIVGSRRNVENMENESRRQSFAGKAPSLSIGANWNSSLDSPFTDSVGGSATLRIPINPWIPGTTQNQSIRNANLAVEQARLELQRAETDAATQIRSLAESLNGLWESIEIARLRLGVAQRRYQLAETAFRNGTVDSQRLETARNSFVDARQRVLQSEFSYLSTILDISAALNMGWKELMQ